MDIELEDNKQFISNIPRMSVHLSIGRDESILVCFKIMDTSVCFNEIYSLDTQAD